MEVSKLVSLGKEAGEDTCYWFIRTLHELWMKPEKAERMLIILVAFTLCFFCLCFCDISMQV